jgi:hypothetical protein
MLMMVNLGCRPYVYHVWAGDEEGMRLAIQAALDNPIES